MVLDAGALIALERGDRNMLARLKGAVSVGQVATTHAGALAQVWRGGHGNQTRLARAVKGLEVMSLDTEAAKAVGVLLGITGSVDVIDAAVVLCARDHDTIYTSDPDDLGALARAAGKRVQLVVV